jgi:hypothetical protein
MPSRAPGKASLFESYISYICYKKYLMPRRKLPTYQERSSRLIALFMLGAVLFNFPLLSLLGKGEKVGSIPGLFLYLGVAWLAMIVLLWLAMHDVPGEAPKKNGP